MSAPDHGAASPEEQLARVAAAEAVVNAAEAVLITAKRELQAAYEDLWFMRYGVKVGGVVRLTNGTLIKVFRLEKWPGSRPLVVGGTMTKRGEWSKTHRSIYPAFHGEDPPWEAIDNPLE